MEGYSPKLPLQKDNIDGLFAMNKTSLESIKQDLKMLLLTNPGERMMIPDYGVGVRRILFSQKTDSVNAFIKNKIEEQVRKFMGFLTIESIEILDVEDNENAIFMNVSFKLPSINTLQELNLQLESN